MVLKSRNSGERASRSSLTNPLALSGRESHLFFYKVVTWLLALNLALLGTQWITAVIVIPGVRQSFLRAGIILAIFLMVFAVWIKPSVEYYWEMARGLSEKNELEYSLSVRSYRLAISIYWQTFVGYSRIWAYLTLVSGLVTTASGCTMICLMLVAPGNEIAELAQMAETTAAWSVVIQIIYCLLAHRTVVILTEENDGGEK